jgi:hypothetical protein
LFIAAALFLIASCTQEQIPIYEAEKITWAQHIAPIIFKNCTPCHRPGESGPFDLLTYHDAIKKAALIKFATSTGYMPPWPADPSYSHFTNEKTISETEKAYIKNWVKGGMLRGDSTKEPLAPVFYRGSYFGKPDLVINSVGEVKIKGNGTDAFMIQKFPYQIEKDTLVDFVEFVPDRRKLIHHVNGHLISYDEKRKFDHMNGEFVSDDIRAQTMDVYKKMHIPYSDNLKPEFPTLTPNTVYYLPGYIPPAYPSNVGGYKLKKNGAFLLNNIHYGPSKSDTIDKSHINVFFRKNKIERTLSEITMGTMGISKIEPEFIIPPNKIKTFYTQTKLSKAISILSVNPHMHLIGTKFLAYALSPKGDTIPLIRINKWDFRWQYYYTFKNPIVLQEGSSIHVYGTFDNTQQNLFNPFHPPQTITNGNGVESMKTTEEMFQFIFTYMPFKEGDEKIDLERKIN